MLLMNNIIILQEIQEYTVYAIIIPNNSCREWIMTEHDEVQDDWITMSEAARRLGINLSKISRLAALNRIETRHNPYDERTRLVNYAELRRMFPPRRGRS